MPSYFAWYRAQNYLQKIVEGLGLAIVRASIGPEANTQTGREFIRQLQINKIKLEHQLELYKDWPKKRKTLLDKIYILLFEWANTNQPDEDPE